MIDVIEIERRLEQLAVEPPIAASGATLPKVRAIARRRRRTSAALRVAAVGSVVAGGMLAFAVSTEDRPAGMVISVTTPVTTTVTTQAPAEQAQSDPSTSNPAVPVETAVVQASPTLLGILATERVAASAMKINEEIALAWGSGFGPNWLVPWNGGFLALGTFGDPSLTGYSSPDGLSWVPSDFALPAGIDGVSDVTVSGDRLVAVSHRRNFGGSDDSGPVVLTTTDLMNWTTQTVTPEPLPVALPAIVQRRIDVDGVIAGTDRWVVPVSERFELDVQQLVEDEVGEMPTSLSSSFGEDRIAVEYGLQDGTDGSTVIVYNDLDLDPAVLDLVRNSAPTVAWAATWGGQPEPLASPPSLASGDFAGQTDYVAVDGGLVAISRMVTINDDGSRDEHASLSATADGTSWSTLDPPDDDTEVVDAIALPEGLGVIGRTPTRPDQIFRVDIANQTWQPMAIAGLPERLSVIDASPSSAGSALWLNPNAEFSFDPGPTITVVAQAEYVLTMTFEFPQSSYEVRRVDTGDVVVAESIDLREHAGSFEVSFDHLTGGITDTTIVDPATGAIIMEISVAEMERAQAESAEVAPAFEPPADPGTLVAASSQTERWFVADLDASPDASDTSYPYLSALSGGVLIVRAEADWFRIDLN